MRSWKRIGAIAILIACAAYAFMDFHGEEPLVEYKVEADSGDTLWGMCAKVASDKDNMQEVVYRAMQENHIEHPGDLRPGQTIVIRVKPLTGENHV